MKTPKNIPWNALLIAFCLIFYFFCNLQKVIIPGSIFNELQSHYQVTAAAITSLGAAFMYVYGGFQLVSGVLVDRYSGARILLWGGGFFTLGSLLSALPVPLPVMTLARLLTGLGASTIYLSMIAEMHRLCGKYYSALVGLAAFIGYSGSAIGSAPFILLTQHYSWQMLLMALACLIIICLVLYVVVMKNTVLAPVRPRVTFSVVTFKKPLMRAANWYMILFLSCIFGSYFTLQTIIGKKLLEDFAGMTMKSAGLVLTFMVIIAALDGVLATAISRLTVGKKIVFLRIAASLAVISLLSAMIGVKLGYREPWFWWTIFLTIATAANFSPLIFMLIPAYNPPESLGTTASIINSGPYVIVAALGNAIGWIMEHWVPSELDGVLVYPPKAYFFVFLLLAFIASFGAAGAFLLKEQKKSRVV